MFNGKQVLKWYSAHIMVIISAAAGVIERGRDTCYLLGYGFAYQFGYGLYNPLGHG